MNTGITLINNDSYGAPELKKVYQVFTLKGFIIAVTFHIALVAAYMLFAYINETKANDIPINKKETKWVEIDLPPTVEDKEIPPVKQEEVVQKVKDLSSLNPEPVKKDIADDVKLKTQDELNNIITNTGREGDSLIASNNSGNNINIEDSKIEDKIIKTENVTTKDTYKDYEVEKAPVCINLDQVKGSLVYPELAIETGAEGRVTAKVLVGTDGNVIKIGSISGNELFHDEVKEKAKDLQFTPGLQNNSPVKVWVTVPFNFKLK